MPGYSYGELRDEYAGLWEAMKIPAGTVSAVDSRIRAIVQGPPALRPGLQRHGRALVPDRHHP